MVDTLPIEAVEVETYTIPTDRPEADGTLAWDSTTIVLVHVTGGGRRGLGYTYADKAAAVIVAGKLAGVVEGRDAMALAGAHAAMLRVVRNLGRPGLCAAAIAAVDNALWDLKARLLDQPLFRLLGAVREQIPIYGSGGFTSYSLDELAQQLAGWVERGIRRVKMKVGTHPERDVARVAHARAAIGAEAELFVDANGAYDRKQALDKARAFADLGATWFEEPVSSDDLVGLRLMRDRAPAPMEIAAGEYGYDHFYFRRMLEAQAVDVLQADATRCLGVSGMLDAGALCRAFSVPLSAHTAPALHMHVCCALPGARHIEYFHDHARIERMLFDGVVEPDGGMLRPDPQRPGFGLELRAADAARFAA